MAYAVTFAGVNARLGPPPGDERVHSLEILKSKHVMTSCWEFSPEEIAEIVKTGRVFLSLFAGAHPPVYVGTEATSRAMLIDYGHNIPKQG